MRDHYEPATYASTASAASSSSPSPSSSHPSSSSPSPPYLSHSFSLGQRVADRVSAVIGSWRFVLTQSLCICVWLLVNLLTATPWDPYPFILLNLSLSFQSAYDDDADDEDDE